MADERKTIKIFGNTGLSDRVALFNKKTKTHSEKQLANPFSEWDGACHLQKLDKGDANYGKPVQGSKTEYRGMKALERISGEIQTLCEMIWEFGEKLPDGTAWIKFGELFEIYTRISSKVVGILLRARKYGLLDFKGEMLFQRRDDNVVIQLIRPITEIRDSNSDIKTEKASAAQGGK